MGNKYLFHLFLLVFTSITIAHGQRIAEEKYVSIGGIEQWVTIKGEDASKPIVLFIHGGPGSTQSQFEQNMYANWTKDFILVHWDQRGAGRTYGRNAPKELDEAFLINHPLSVETMTNDGIALTQYLLNHLNKKKVILIGSSWGSVLATKMALNKPALFHAYVGHAQIVNFSKNIQDAYETVFELARDHKDKETKEMLDLFGRPPYEEAKNYGKLLRIIKKYEAERETPAPASWFQLASGYDNEKDSEDRFNGDDYSFVNLVGQESLGIISMVSGIDFGEDALHFKLPILLIQGEGDILTSMKLNKAYFDKISAPNKAYFLLPNAAHGFNQSVIDKQYEVITKYLSIE
ncbi:alpha/beta hydrolase [uncultured Cyclobacterium sp.]|uniref:alpha/beta hydrolase n=1 Tax=uncultured Cyclobacterium sp. TaxID=453820 RepID=UPI0030ED7383|tara:strand:- start:44669 stop:45712 length:1044 start_codon:yes stop_codon:yes gene_type:complete